MKRLFLAIALSAIIQTVSPIIHLIPLIKAALVTTAAVGGVAAVGHSQELQHVLNICYQQIRNVGSDAYPWIKTFLSQIGQQTPKIADAARTVLRGLGHPV